LRKATLKKSSNENKETYFSTLTKNHFLNCLFFCKSLLDRFKNLNKEKTEQSSTHPLNPWWKHFCLSMNQ
jgi:hypothetical protein